MSIPDKITFYHEMNMLDRVINNVASKETSLTQSDINKVIVTAQIQEGIERYRSSASSMTSQSLRAEEHNSARLARHLEEKLGPRPSRCHAHAIVAGRHSLSAELRVVLAKLKIRIDDPDNGCWLPENTAATPLPKFPSAPPHSRIHRYNYYYWINGRLSPLRREGLMRTNLQLVARMLQTGDFPEFVMLKKGRGIPA